MKSTVEMCTVEIFTVKIYIVKISSFTTFSIRLAKDPKYLDFNNMIFQMNSFQKIFFENFKKLKFWCNLADEFIPLKTKNYKKYKIMEGDDESE